MKNNRKRNLTKILFYLSFALLFTLTSCESDDANCGCNSSTIFTIQENDEQIGFLYRNTDNSNANIPPYSYGIYHSEPNCSNCVHKFFICNNAFLNNFGEIPEYPGIKVQFSGHSKKVCQGIWAPADYTYNYLTLTQIKQQ